MLQSLPALQQTQRSPPQVHKSHIRCCLLHSCHCNISGMTAMFVVRAKHDRPHCIVCRSRTWLSVCNLAICAVWPSMKYSHRAGRGTGEVWPDCWPRTEPCATGRLVRTAKRDAVIHRLVAITDITTIMTTMLRQVLVAVARQSVT